MLFRSTSTITSAANITGGNLLTGGLVSATANVTGGNMLTGGLISATSTITSSANITGGNLLTGGLVSATSTVTGSSILGSVVSVTANITGGNLLSGGLASVTGNITGGNILTAGIVSATGNITGNYYIGNGAFLTGITGGGGGGGSNISNGATSINIPQSSGNITFNVAGASNTVVVNLGSLTMYGTFAGPKTLTANVSVADAVNALLIGPVTIANNANITVPDTSTLYVYAP